MATVRAQVAREWLHLSAEGLARRWADPRWLRFAATAILACAAALWVAGFLGQRARGWTGATLGGDYAAFWIAGRIHAQAPAELYDRALQSRLYHELFAGEPPDVYLPFANPPFVAAFFSLLGGLPYAASYAVWSAISLALYVGGILLALSTCKAMPAPTRRLAMLLALAFEPFVIETFHGGQLTSLGVFAVGLFLWLGHRDRPWIAGAALALLLYKPTLLVWIGPAMVLTGQWRMLAGFGLGAAALTCASVVLAGWPACVAYGQNLLHYARWATESEAVFRTWKFVDVNSFCRLLGAPALGPVALAACGACVAAWMWRHRAQPQRVFAMAVLATPIINLYVGIYDMALAVPALLALAGDRPGPLPRRVTALIALVYAAPWVTQHLAAAVGAQIITPLAVLAVARLALPADPPTARDSAPAPAR
jgi:hypothetical protein